jgi:hypothetical protein
LDDFTAQKTWFLLVTQWENCVSPLGEPHRLCGASRLLDDISPDVALDWRKHPGLVVYQSAS